MIHQLMIICGKHPVSICSLSLYNMKGLSFARWEILESFSQSIEDMLIYDNPLQYHVWS